MKNMTIKLPTFFVLSLIGCSSGHVKHPYEVKYFGALKTLWAAKKYRRPILRVLFGLSSCHLYTSHKQHEHTYKNSQQ